MNDNNSLLDALTHRGVLISVSVRYWRARKKLNPEDLGLQREQIDNRLISLGHKRLLPKERMQRLALLEGRAHALVEENTFPFLNGVARYLPNTKLEQVTGKLNDLQSDFEHEQRVFLSQYTQLREGAVGEWRDVAENLVEDPERLVAVIEHAFPPADVMPRYFGFDIRMFQIAVPDVPQTELIELGTQQEIMAARQRATESARQEIDRSCRNFIADCVSTLREQTAQLCTEMLATITSSESVHQKTLNRLVKFVDHFRQLNFTGDVEMERQLENVREQFLQRTAADYRDSDFARERLVQGLTKLRETAQEMASQDARELVEGFGQMGRRRFALAA